MKVVGGLGIEQFYWGMGLNSKEYKKMFVSNSKFIWNAFQKKKDITQAIANYDGVKLHNICSAKFELIAM